MPMRRERIKAVLQRAVSSLSLCSTMKAAGALILLLWCLSEAGAQEQRGPPEPDNSQPDLWDQVRQLRDMGLLQGEKMKTMEAEAKELRDTVVEQGNTLMVQGEKLESKEAEVQELRDTVVEQGNTLVVQREKLKDAEEDTKEQRDLVSDLRMELAITKYQMKGKAK